MAGFVSSIHILTDPENDRLVEDGQCISRLGEAINKFGLSEIDTRCG